MTNTASTDPASGHRPAVTIGVPVYNGERYLKRALDSLLGQTFGDFELVISDNASTDQTAQICKALAARDPRIRYVRAPSNLGASWNFNRVVELARGDLFVWAAHDDWWYPTFLDRCTDVLQRRPGVVACYSHYQGMDGEGNATGPIRGPEGRCEGETVRERWNHVIRNPLVHGSIYGVLRTAALRRTRGVLACQGSDLILMTELALQGEIAVVDEILHHKYVPLEPRTPRQVLVTLGARKIRPALMVRRHFLIEQIRGLRHSSLPDSEKRTLEREAWIFYARSRAWLYDTVETAQKILGQHRVKRLTQLARRLGIRASGDESRASR